MYDCMCERCNSKCKHLDSFASGLTYLVSFTTNQHWRPLGPQNRAYSNDFFNNTHIQLDYGCIVCESARGSYLRMLDLIQNHAFRLCLGAYRTSPSSSLSVLANEPPVYIRRKRLSMQYCLKLSSTPQNPAYSRVLAGKFKFAFDRKPNQILL